MSIPQALASGVGGAVALTLVHESARHVLSGAPRMDLLGMRAIAAAAREAGREPPPADRLHTSALAGDLVANSLFYSLVGVGRPSGAFARGALLGLIAGVGAVALPGPLGFGSDAGARTPATAALTIAWYVVGGLAAGAAYHRLAARPAA